MTAAYRCVNCGKELCAVCMVRVDDKAVCRDCAEELRKHPAPAPADPQPESAAPESAAAPQPASAPAPASESKPTDMPVPVAPSAISPASRPKLPAVPHDGTGGPRAKESLLAAALSLILPGVGQMYNGQVVKGLVLAVVYIGTIAVILGGAVVCAIIASRACFCCMPLFIVPLIVLIYAIYDAYMTAEKINNRQEVKDWF